MAEVTPRRQVRIAIIGKFDRWPWGQHPDEAYVADALQAIGINVMRIDQDKHQGPQSGVEWAFFTGHPGSRNLLPAWSKTHRTIFWTLDWIPNYGRQSMIDAAKQATLFLSSDQYDWKGVYGITNHSYLPGACEGIQVNLDAKPKRPCAFLGSLYNERRQRIAKLVQSMGGEVRIQPGGWVYGKALAEYVQATKVIVGDNAVNDCPGYWSSRNYIIPGSGGFLLTSKVPGLEKQFEFKRHLDVYGSLEELAEKLKYWIAQDKERETIRRVGFNHVQVAHNWKERAMSMVRILEDHGRV